MSALVQSPQDKDLSERTHHKLQKIISFFSEKHADVRI